MKQLIMSLFIIGSVSLLGGCCTDDVSCGSETMYMATSVPCSSCGNTSCNTCYANTCSGCGGYTTYTYGGWY